MSAGFQLWVGQAINGLVLGNIYALLAAGLALIFGVANLINFAHGSVYMAGSFAGWFLITSLGWPLRVNDWIEIQGSALFYGSRVWEQWMRAAFLPQQADH